MQKGKKPLTWQTKDRQRRAFAVKDIIIAVPISLNKGRGQRHCCRYSCGADVADSP